MAYSICWFVIVSVTIGSGVVSMVAGIVIGIIGFILCGINYPIYKRMLERDKSKYAYEIVELAREISEER